MLEEDIIITTGILLRGAIIFAILDAVIFFILVRSITADFFAQIKWPLIFFSGIFWFGIWRWVISVFWDKVYIFVFPFWAKHWLPFIFGILMAGVSFGIWMIAIKSHHHPLPSFLMLSGFWGILTHIWAIYRGILTKPPMLRGSSPFAALLVAFFEYIFYWCIIILLSSTPRWISLRFKKRSFPK